MIARFAIGGLAGRDSRLRGNDVMGDGIRRDGGAGYDVMGAG